jgi:glycosyltransferase involved in cell wall biosynthesis
MISTPSDTVALSLFAKLVPGIKIGWIGAGRPIRGLKSEGYQNFITTAGKAIINQYDFLLTVSRADANPATILEAMAWGLIPVCTLQSGYHGFEGIINIPLDNPTGVKEVMDHLQNMPAKDLKKMQIENWKILDEHFSWDRFGNQVIQAIESDESPPILPISAARRLKLRWLSLLAPYATWRRVRHLSRVALWVLKKR